MCLHQVLIVFIIQVAVSLLVLAEPEAYRANAQRVTGPMPNTFDKHPMGQEDEPKIGHILAKHMVWSTSGKTLELNTGRESVGQKFD